MTIQEFKNEKIGMAERLAYGCANFGGNLIYATISSFASFFYTNSVGIAAATVGTMMLVARVFDALSDVMMGDIIDRTHTKQGQAKPWYTWSVIPLALSLVLVFALPASWGNTAKVIYMYATYIWSAVFCYTANSLSAVAMQSLMTGSSEERMKLNASYQILGFICIIGVNMFTSNLAEAIGWMKLSVIYALVATVFLMITVFLCKERKHIVTDRNELQNEDHKVTLKEGLPVLLSNRYAIIILILSILNYITIGAFNGGGVYYATFIYGNGGLFGLMTLAGMLPTILLSTVIPHFGARYGKKNVLAAGYLLQMIGYGIVQFFGTALPLMIVGLVIKAAGLACVTGLLIPLIGDVVEYGELTSGLRLDGLTNAISTCGLKVGTGLGSAFIGWFLAWGGYAAEAAVQSESALFAMKLLVGGLPAICGLLGFLIALAFDIEKKLASAQN